MIEAGSQLTDKVWQAAILQDLKNTLVTKPWSRELFLRGSLAHGLADAESDVDLVVAILEQEFDSAVKELVCSLPKSLPGKLPPWFDTIVRDFGGIGLVYLLQIDEHKWGELDVYALPENRRQQFVDNEHARSLWKLCSSADCGDAKPPNVDNARRYYSQLASCDAQQAVLACYLAIFLLRKRLLRRDRFQTFSDTYAAALSVRDLIVLTCYPERSEHGWYGLEKVVERAPAPTLISRVLSQFSQYDVFDPTGLSARVEGLEELVALLVPVTWREHGESLRRLGAYISGPKCHAEVLR